MKTGIDKMDDLVRPDAIDDVQKISRSSGKRRRHQDAFGGKALVQAPNTLFKIKRTIDFIQLGNRLNGQSGTITGHSGNQLRAAHRDSEGDFIKAAIIRAA